MARRTKDAPGRVTPKGTQPTGAKGRSSGKSPADRLRRTPVEDDRPRYAREATGRYTAPDPTWHESSPWWVPTIMLIFFGAGLLMIVINYVGVLLPGCPSNWYLLGGLGSIIVGFIISTRWH